jgi:hypothetical protein
VSAPSASPFPPYTPRHPTLQLLISLFFKNHLPKFSPSDDGSLLAEVAMSLVGDFVAVFQLAENARQRFKNAPQQYKSISTE